MQSMTFFAGWSQFGWLEALVLMGIFYGVPVLLVMTFIALITRDKKTEKARAIPVRCDGGCVFAL